MSWLIKDATRDDLLALHPGLALAHHDLIDSIWDGPVDPRTLELCRVRTAMLLQSRVGLTEPLSAAAVAAGMTDDDVAALSTWTSSQRFDESVRDCLSLAEQFVLDVHGVTDELVARVSSHIGAEGVVTLTTALAAWEITHRMDNALLSDDSLED